METCCIICEMSHYIPQKWREAREHSDDITFLYIIVDLALVSAISPSGIAAPKLSFPWS